MKTKQNNTGQASTETHADGELRNSHKERKCGETQICTQEGARPPTWAVNPQMGEPLSFTTHQHAQTNRFHTEKAGAFCREAAIHICNQAIAVVYRIAFTVFTESM